MSQAAPDHQSLLALRAYLTGHLATAEPAQVPERFHRQRWNELHDRGWSAILLPAADGGAGGTFRRLAEVAELIGETLSGTALVGNAMAHLALSLSTHGGEVWDAAVGDTLDGAQLAFIPGAASAGPGRLRLCDGRLHGSTPRLPDLAVADLLVVIAEDESSHEWAGYLVTAHQPGVVVLPQSPGDSTRVFGSVRFNGVPVGSANALTDGPLPAHLAHALLLELAATLVGVDAMGGARRYLADGAAAPASLLATIAEARARLDLAVTTASEVVMRALDTGECDRAARAELARGASAAAAMAAAYLALTEPPPVGAAAEGHVRHRYRALQDNALLEPARAWVDTAPRLFSVG
jgi:alkylation response protein AidB-like acyl-CoA dehydrogenase